MSANWGPGPLGFRSLEDQGLGNWVLETGGLGVGDTEMAQRSERLVMWAKSKGLP